MQHGEKRKKTKIKARKNSDCYNSRIKLYSTRFLVQNFSFLVDVHFQVGMKFLKMLSKVFCKQDLFCYGIYHGEKNKLIQREKVNHWLLFIDTHNTVGIESIKCLDKWIFTAIAQCKTNWWQRVFYCTTNDRGPSLFANFETWSHTCGEIPRCQLHVWNLRCLLPMKCN